MFDPFFQNELQKVIVWHQGKNVAPFNQTAFRPYMTLPDDPTQPDLETYGQKKENMNKRMVEFMRREWKRSKTQSSSEMERERCFKHMMSERMRRERQKQEYSALHSMLPYRTKNDKNSIVETAGSEIRKLKKREQELEMQNTKLQGNNVNMLSYDGPRAIHVRVDHPSSSSSSSSSHGIDSLLLVLHQLKSLGSPPTRVRALFHPQQFSAQLLTQSQGEEAGEIEKNLQRSLLQLNSIHSSLQK